ncbi:MAG: hypothetical protein EZS28_048258, partial [Streblomastix strix]
MFVIFALITLSLGADYEKGRLYFEPGTVDKDGLVTIDIGNAKTTTDNNFFKVIKIEQYKQLVEGTKVEDAKFLPVVSDETEFNSLKTIDAPYGDSFVCAVINQAFSTNLHGLLGFKVKATAKANIAPS